jgi:alanine racemase
MTIASRRAWATIDLNALRKNLSRVRSLCPESRIYPVIKSNAYGHGVAQAAAALKDSHTNIAGFGVATVEEALQLRKLEADLPILLLNGFVTDEELQECLRLDIEPVIHATYQMESIERVLADDVLGHKRKFWVKYNTGMNRLGMNSEDSRQSFLRLKGIPGTELVLMSHFACADDPDNAAFTAITEKQLAALIKLRGELVNKTRSDVECSLAASAGILQWPNSHLDYVRPGVMLYGSSPMANANGEDLGLQPVMTLSSRLISIRDLKAGDAIGYSATYVCDRDTRVGTVSIGYGDGYPRAAENGTPVLLKTANGLTRTQLIGRVSMDMITIDLTGIEGVAINDEVVLWGEGLCADEVAKYCGTIAYELFCKVTPRVEFNYINE